MNKKRKIAKKLDQLQELLNSIEEARIINPDDPDTWDSDTLYNLVENLKEALKLLEDQPLKGELELQSNGSSFNNERHEFGQPLTEDGLCSLIDLYQEDQENDEE
jgi:hypothetical protein